MSLEVLTERRIRELGGLKSAQIKINGRHADFVSGYMLDGLHEGESVELIYEVPCSAGFRLFVKAFEFLQNDMFEELYDGSLFRVQCKSLSSLNNERNFFTIEDTRFNLIGSRRIYKAFLTIIDDQKLKNLISDERYMAIFERLGRRLARMQVDVMQVPLRDKEVIREYRDVLEQDGLFQPYLSMAKGMCLGTKH